ncbi:MAG: efflux RND transporter periplasmic adaptor subunit [Planctomycetota bacterium]
MRPSRRHLLALLLLCAPACSVSAGSEDQGAEASSDTAESGSAPAKRETVRQTKVVVEGLSVGPVRDEIVVSAKVASRTTVALHSKLGNLAATQVLVEAGDPVSKGQLLVTLFDQDLQLMAQTAAAVLDETRRTVERNQLTLEEDRRRVTRAEREAQKAAADLARLQGLGDLVNRQEVENARVTAENASDDLDLARFTERSADIALELGQIAVRKAQIEEQRVRDDLEHTHIRSPIDGIVAERSLNVGELVNSGQRLLRLVDTADLVLNLRVPQDALARLQRGQPVEVRSVTDSSQRFTGTVRSVNPVLDEATGTVHVVVDLVPAPGLVPGLFAEAHIITSAREQATLVSKRAVLYEDDQPVLFTVNGDGTARKLAFRAGASTPTALEVLSDLDGVALPLDLRVIVVGQENLKDGAPVQVVEGAF